MVRHIDAASPSLSLSLPLAISEPSASVKQVSFTVLPQPFVNPADAFSQLKSESKKDS